MKKIIILLFLLSTSSYAGVMRINPPTEVIAYSNGQLGMSFQGQKPTLIYPDLENRYMKVQQPVRIPTSVGRQVVTIPRSYKLPTAKIGRAASNFLKNLPFVGTAIALYQTACDFELVCTDPETGQLGQRIEDAPATLPHNYTYNILGGGTTTDPQTLCDQSYPVWESTFPPQVWIPSQAGTIVNNNGQSVTCRFQVGTTSNIQPFYVSIGHISCPSGYFLIQNICEATPETLATRYRPLTDADWSRIEPALTSPEITQELIDNEVPLELDEPVNEPFQKDIGTKTETVRDSTGTAIGTKTTTKTVKGDPVTGSSDEYNITEITTITNTDLTTNTTTTTTIEDTPADNNDDDEIEFDEPENEPELQEYIPDTNFDYQSWGNGTCPADKSATTSHGTLTFSYEPICNTVTNLKPVVIVIAGFISMFIIAGARNDN